ncbi:MAG: hypothetical protein KDA22_01900, partial [Phycisphaerales bacterium]|nr:hypothetical protein [Phycisphaerales bacterium]
MNTVCRACAHELLPKQDQCPECGAEDAWSIVVDTAAASDLSWHRGWIGRVVGAGIAMAMLVGGARITLGGHAAMWTAVGGAFFLLGLALVVGAIRGVVERIRRGSQCPEGSLRATRRMIHIDPDILSSPLAAVDAVELAPTARADRWWLVLHLSPADACVLPRERTAMILKEFGAWALEGVSLDEAVAPVQGAWRVLLGGSRDDAEAVRARIDRLGVDARRGRPVVG